ncbi:uncharacterized protein LOC141855173 [Brevipalpus obovatus]|uniref:uncharacterized protein LOC141855173 n=1 Tax=Brevipalpus obovatus TaxID=246614 RepID=UPI003D9E69A9
MRFLIVFVLINHLVSSSKGFESIDSISSTANSGVLRALHRPSRATTSAKDDSSCHDQREAMKISVKKVLLLDNEKFPGNRQEVDQLCEAFIQFHKGLKKYLKCLSTLERQAFVVFASGFKRLIRTYCSNDKKRKEALETLTCATPESMGGYHLCLTRANRQVDFVGANSTNEQMLGDLCSVFPQVAVCLEEKTSKKKDCAFKNADPPRFLKNIVSTVMKDSLDLVCGSSRSQDGILRTKAIADIQRDVEGIFLLSPVGRVLRRISGHQADH